MAHVERFALTDDQTRSLEGRVPSRCLSAGSVPRPEFVVQAPEILLVLEEKRVDLVGLYLQPQEHAIALSVGEASPVQAQGRSRRGGTASPSLPGRRPEEWLRFLQQVERDTPQRLALHIICDNYSTHKHPAISLWLKDHPRVHLHFSSNPASWLNLVERLFRGMTENPIHSGIFQSVPELEAAIHTAITGHPAAPRPFAWVAAGQDLLAKVAQARTALAATGTPSGRD